MKYTILINQAGIMDAGLGDKTDFSDWAILEYVVGWQSHSSALRYGDHVWLNYNNLLVEIPMLGVKSKSGVSGRVGRLRDLGLLSTMQTDDNRLFVRVTDFYLSVVGFRATGEVANSAPMRPMKQALDVGGEHAAAQVGEAKAQGNQSGADCSAGRTAVQLGEHPVQLGEHPVQLGEHPVQLGEHSINNNNKLLNKTKHNAGEAGEGESAYGDELVFDKPMQWAQFFIQACAYPFHIVQTAKTIPMFASWVADKTSVGEIRLAMAACHGWNNGRVPDSPLLYGKFLQSVRDAKSRMADEAVFESRPGVGKQRHAEDWMRVPRGDEELWPWAKKHGYPDPGRMTYREYRARLHSAVETRLAKSAAG